MKDIILNNYFWQEGVIRLRAIQPEDWEEHYNNRFDTPARRLLDYEVELPPTMVEAKSFAEEFATDITPLWIHFFLLLVDRGSLAI